MDILINALDNFLKTLDWTFIFGLVLLAYLLTRDAVVNGLSDKIQKKLQRVATVYWVLLIGVIFGIAEYYIRGINTEPKELKRVHLESLIISYFFATSFYDLIIKRILDKLNMR